MSQRAWTFMVTTLIGLALAAAPTLAQRGDDANRLSKNGRTEGTLDGVEVTIEYGRPQVKGRVLWGGLVPYDKVWRTGADEATTIAFGGPVLVEGQPLPAGTYSLFTVPGESEWTVIFNQVASQWGSFNYDAGQDALRVTVEPRAGEHVEALEFQVEGSEVVLRWGELAVPVQVEAAP